jgi:site-specific recombinase XerD
MELVTINSVEDCMDGNILPISPNSMELIHLELYRDPRLKSKHSRQGYEYDLRAFETWRSGRSLTKRLIEEYLAVLVNDGRAPNAINRALAAIRWWARRVIEMLYEQPAIGDQRVFRDLMIDQAERISKISDVEGEIIPKGRIITQAEFSALLNVCEGDSSPAGCRDAGIFIIAWMTGCRRSEIASLQLDDFTKVDDVNGEILINGKGSKQRKTYVFDEGLKFLERWVEVRGSDPGPLFLAINKAGHMQPGHGLSDEALAQMLGKRRQQAGIEKLSWHDFRRTFCSTLLTKFDLATVQALMGHASPTTTILYDRRGEDVRKAAIKSIKVPLPIQSIKMGS